MTNSSSTGLVQVRIPAVLTLAGLIAGLLLGLLIAGSDAEKTVLAVSAPVGSLWLRALQMTIIPLVAALLIIGIAQMAQAAQAGSTARRTIGWIVTMLALSAAASCLLMPLLLEAFPVPGGAAGLLLKGGAAQPSEVPSLADFVTSLVSPNIVAAAAETAMLPLTVFFAALALAIVRLAEAQRELRSASSARWGTRCL